MSTFIIINLLLGAAALMLLLPLRPSGGDAPKAVLGLGAGLIAGILVINGATSLLATSRDSNIRPVVKYLTENADSAKPQMLLVGSSYTALGVDDARIERELRKDGLSVQVLNLSKPGNFMVSQDYTIDYYLARSKKIPDYIFIEFGPEYYNDSGAMGDSYLNTGTAIADHTPGQVLWRVRSINAYSAAPAERAEKFWNLSTHTLFNIFDFGLSGQLLAEKDLSAVPAFQPSDVATTPVKPAELMELAQPASAGPPGPLEQNVRFIVEFRRMQIQKLKSRGVKVVGFYQTVMAPLGMRNYAALVCRELRGVPCILGNDPGLRRSLGHVDRWDDPVHLLHPGAEIYSTWFADRLSDALRSRAVKN